MENLAEAVVNEEEAERNWIELAPTREGGRRYLISGVIIETVDEEGHLFRYADIEKAFSKDIKPLFKL